MYYSDYNELYGLVMDQQFEPSNQAKMTEPHLGNTDLQRIEEVLYGSSEG
jgi:hypothetical protein